MKSAVFTLVVAVVLGVGLLSAHRWHTEEMVSLRREIASMRESQNDALIRQTAAHVEPSVKRGRAPSSSTEPRAAPTLEPTAAATVAVAATKTWEEDVDAKQAALEVRFAAQTADESWSRPVQRELHEQLTSLLPESSKIDDLDCRSSICRVTFTHHDQSAFETFLHGAFLDLEDRVWEGPGHISPAESHGDGSVSVVMYLGREGSELMAAR